MKKMIPFVLMVLLFSTLFTAQAKPDPSNLKSRHHRTHHVAQSQKKGPININTADVNALATLKGVGPKKAGSIVAYRKKHGNFKSVEGLSSVPGIGKKGVTRLIKNNPSRLVLNG